MTIPCTVRNETFDRGQRDNDHLTLGRAENQFSLWRALALNFPRSRRRANSTRRFNSVESLEVRLLPAATTIGNVFDVPSRTINEQLYDNVAAGPDGSFTVVFADSSFDSSGFGIYARRFSANGVPAGNQFRINSTVADNQYFPSIATNSAGLSLVAWENQYYAGGYTYPLRLDLQFLNSNGTLLGSNVTFIPENLSEIESGHYLDGTSWGYATKPWTFVDNEDQFWIAVPIARNGEDGYGKLYQFWSASPGGEVTKQFESRLPDETPGGFTVRYDVEVEIGDDGTFYVLYDTENSVAVPDVGQQYTSQLLVQRFDSATHEQIGSDLLVHSAVYLDDVNRVEHKQPTLVPESDGKFSVLYYNDASDLVAQHFNADGSKNGSLVEFIDHAELNAGYGVSKASVQILSNGNWLLAWTVPRAFDDDTSYVREFQTDGTPVGHAVELGTAYYFGTLHAAAQGNDQFVYTWQDGGGVAGYGDVFARRVIANVPVPGVTVTPLTALQTTEAGGTASFQVVLDAPPTQSVSIPVSVNYPDMVGVSASQLDFTTSNWNIPQTITLTGQNDYLITGDIYYDLELGPTVSTDTSYNGLTINPLSLINIDDDVAGVTVTPTSGLQVSENATTATFSVVLTSQPYENVSLNVASSDTTEGTVNKSFLTFTNTNWNVPQVVTITGINDALTDGNVAFQVTLSNAISTDFDYSGLNVPDVSVTNLDNDVPGISVTPTTALNTSEAGTTASFQVVLQTQPSAQVTITLQSDDTSEGTANKSTLTFTPANWNVPQLVTLTGQDDFIDDGDVTYQINFTSVTSADADYNNLSITNLSLQNTDNDTAGFTVTPTTGLQTTETGGAASFTVRLNSKPLNDVTVSVSSSDPDEGTPSLSELVFTSANWDLPQAVTVTGVDDGVADGNTAYQILLGPATSSDQTYNGLNPQDVSLVNRPPNVAPTLQLSGGNPTFGKRGSPVSVVSTTAVTDDQPHLAGGRVRISITAGFDVSDMLSISTTIGGLSIGTLSHSGANYFVDLNANATPTALQQLLQSVKFSTEKRGLRSPARTIEFQLTDSEGAVSTAVQLGVQVSKKKLK